MFTSENHCKAIFENVHKVNFRVTFLANSAFFVLHSVFAC